MMSDSDAEYLTTAIAPLRLAYNVILPSIKVVEKKCLGRCLKSVDSLFARRLLARSQDEIVIEISPEKIYSWNFTKRMQDSIQ